MTVSHKITYLQHFQRARRDFSLVSFGMCITWKVNVLRWTHIVGTINLQVIHEINDIRKEKRRERLCQQSSNSRSNS